MKGVFFMVKGISRRVVVVRPESGGPFEQAIFLVRDPAFPRGDAVREACRIAEGCLGSACIFRQLLQKVCGILNGQ